VSGGPSPTTRVLALGTAHAATDFYQGTVAVLVPVLVLEHGYSALQASVVVLVATMGSALAQPLFGLLADRADTYWLLPVSMLLSGVGIGAIGVVPTYGWALTAAAVSGLGVAAFHPVAARTARRVGGSSARTMSWFIAGGNVGLALAPAISAPILAAVGTSGSPALALPGVLGGLAMMRARGWMRAVAHRGAGVAALDRDEWGAFAWLTVVAILRAGAYFGTTTIIGLFVIEELGGDATAASAVLGVYLVVGIVATLAGGSLADRRSRVGTIRLGTALSLLGLLLLAASGSLWSAAAAAVVVGIGTFLPFSVQTALGQQYLPHHLGTASGVTIGLSVSAGGAFAPLVGLLTDDYDARIALTALALLPLIGLVASTRLVERQS